jgi:hypothetical protein
MDPLKIITNQTVSVSGTSAAVTNAFGNGTTIIRVVSTTDCFIKFGATPTAVAADMLLPAYVVEYFGATPGVKIAALQNTAAGTLYVTEMTK